LPDGATPLIFVHYLVGAMCLGASSVTVAFVIINNLIKFNQNLSAPNFIEVLKEQL
jgi:hypothetical protein